MSLRDKLNVGMRVSPTLCGSHCIPRPRCEIYGMFRVYLMEHTLDVSILCRAGGSFKIISSFIIQYSGSALEWEVTE